MGGVATAEAHRGQGLASAVVGAVCERFDAAGGRLLYLGTMNPVARRIYEQLGFRPVAGQILCRAASGAAGRRLRGRPEGGRAARLVARHGRHRAALPLAAPVRAGGRGHRAAFLARRRAAAMRPHLLGTCGRAWNRRALGVLQNDLGWLVASAIARPTAVLRAPVRTRRLRGFSVDFLWHPDYSVEAAAFVAAGWRRSRPRQAARAGCSSAKATTGKCAKRGNSASSALEGGGGRWNWTGGKCRCCGWSAGAGTREDRPV